MLATALRDNHNLATLNLRSNQLYAGRRPHECIVNLLKTNLATLILSGNGIRLDEDGIDAIANALKNTTDGWERVDLSQNTPSINGLASRLTPNLEVTLHG